MPINHFSHPRLYRRATPSSHSRASDGPATTVSPWHDTTAPPPPPPPADSGGTWDICVGYGKRGSRRIVLENRPRGCLPQVRRTSASTQVNTRYPAQSHTSHYHTAILGLSATSLAPPQPLQVSTLISRQAQAREIWQFWRKCSIPTPQESGLHWRRQHVGCVV